MLELRHTSHPSIRKLARIDNLSEVLPGGDLVYSKGEGKLIMSPLAVRYRMQGLDVTRFLDKRKTIFTGQRETREGMQSIVTKEYAGKGEEQKAIAVKRLVDRYSDSDGDLNGIEQFTALRALQAEGIPCALPLAATKKELITEWVDKPLVSKSREAMDAFPAYLDALDQKVVILQQKGKWQENCKVERQPANYAIGDVANPDILLRFIAIDPAYIHSSFYF